jgi:hypothetical protein
LRLGRSRGPGVEKRGEFLYIKYVLTVQRGKKGKGERVKRGRGKTF